MTWKSDLIEEALTFITEHRAALEELKSSKASRQDFARALGNEYFHRLRSHVETLPPPRLASIIMSKPEPSQRGPDETTIRDVDPGLDCINIESSGKTIMYLMATLLIMAEATDQLFQVAQKQLSKAA